MEVIESEIIFEDHEVRVMWRPAAHPGDVVLITFGDLAQLANGKMFFAEEPTRKMGLPVVGVMSKTSHWYPTQSMKLAAEFIALKLEHYETRVIYGGSMGGYAAIKHSALFNASVVIALCPQWSVDLTECPSYNSWTNHFSPVMSGMGIRGSDISGKIFIFRDWFDAVDRFHSRKIEDVCEDCVVINMPMVAHAVTNVLSGSSNFAEIMRSCLSGDVTSLRSITRGLRRFHFHRQYNLAEKAAGPYPKLSFKIICDNYKKHGQFVELGTRHLFDFVEYFVGIGDLESAAQCVGRFRDQVTDPHKQLMLDACLGKGSDGAYTISTHFGTVIVYDLSRDCCLHIDQDRLTLRHSAIKLRVGGGRVAMAASIKGLHITLGIDALGKIVSCGNTDGSDFTLGIEKDGTFTLKSSEAFLSAEPSGNLVCNRDQPGLWETFRLFSIDERPAAPARIAHHGGH